MAGLDRDTGKPLDGWPHVSKSIADLLTTALGERVERRAYGAGLHEMIDRPINAATVARAAQAIATALYDWEPRFEVTRVRIDEASAEGQLGLIVFGNYFPRGHLGDFTPEEQSLEVTL